MQHMLDAKHDGQASWQSLYSSHSSPNSRMQHAGAERHVMLHLPLGKSRQVTSRKFVTKATRDELVFIPSQVPPFTRSLGDSRPGALGQKCTASVGLHTKYACHTPYRKPNNAKVQTTTASNVPFEKLISIESQQEQKFRMGQKQNHRRAH
jgi:hypothetical protein